MKRGTKPKTPTAILTADWEFREEAPVCRTDDYLKAMIAKVDFVSDLQQKYDCEVWHAGDLFEHWKPSPLLLTQIINIIPDRFFTVFGNHDLPQHNLNLMYKSGIMTLAAAEKLRIIECGHWGEEIRLWYKTYRAVSVWHGMAWTEKEPPYPGLDKTSHAKSLLKKYPQFDLIVTGHNHQCFVEEYEGRLLVNPGSLMRSTADQIDHEPSIFLWYKETNEVEQIKIPIEQGVITREHIDKTKDRDERIEAFVEKLNNDWETEVNYKENLTRFFQANDIDLEIENIVWQCLEVDHV